MEQVIEMCRDCATIGLAEGGNSDAFRDALRTCKQCGPQIRAAVEGGYDIRIEGTGRCPDCEAGRAHAH